ncbi:hypothetical protein C8R44DRAFT_891211 [Mycena epipterygia]|nr:hypothetical protein C8R44DRAFT_891211 [Mycena epipterygia]
MKFIVNRIPPSISMLSRIRGPIALVHCSDDIVYPLSDAEEVLELHAKLRLVDGAPHFGNPTHPEEINTLLYDAESPFLAELVECGLLDCDSDSDSDSALRGHFILSERLYVWMGLP